MEELGHVADEMIEVERLWIERLAARKGEEPAGQPGGALCALEGEVGRTLDPRVVAGLGAADIVEAAEDDGEEVVEIVGDAAGELADRLHLLRLEEELAGTLELLLGGNPLGDVSRDL